MGDSSEGGDKGRKEEDGGKDQVERVIHVVLLDVDLCAC